MTVHVVGNFFWRPLLPDLAALAHQPKLARLNAQSVRIAILLLIIAALNFVDLRYTLFAQQVGLLGEVNPIAANFLAQGLVPSLIGYKVLCTLVASMLLWRARASRWTPAVCWMLVALYVVLGIMWFCWTRTLAEIKHDEMMMLLSP